mmetsp:Transcript_6450/g.11533  ORF Transcript_6450/g.11533 Transcript_6450/m.11533 type:complete len:362 (-) Transcript_6450:2001-3086(-)
MTFRDTFTTRHGTFTPVAPRQVVAVDGAGFWIAVLFLSAVSSAWDSAAALLNPLGTSLRSDSTITGHWTSLPVPPLIPFAIHWTVDHVAVCLLLGYTNTLLATVLPCHCNVAETLDLSTPADFGTLCPLGPFTPFAIPWTALSVAEIDLLRITHAGLAAVSLHRAFRACAGHGARIAGFGAQRELCPTCPLAVSRARLLSAALRFLVARTTDVILSLALDTTPLCLDVDLPCLKPLSITACRGASRPVGPLLPTAIHRTTLCFADAVLRRRSEADLSAILHGDLLYPFAGCGATVAALAASAPLIPLTPHAVHRAGSKVARLRGVAIHVALLSIVLRLGSNSAMTNMGSVVSTGGSAGSPL